MANYNNSAYTYAQVLAGTGYYQKDDQLKYSSGVYQMQAKLNITGYTFSAPDGKFGQETDDAVRRFQRFQNLDIDGCAGQNTLTKLDEVHSALIAGYDSPNSAAREKRQSIVEEAEYWIGKIPYCIDSVQLTQILDKNNPPPYMDCADFSSSVYLTILGIKIGYNTKEQIKRGIAVPKEYMLPGDLILFDWNSDNDGLPNHVGICSYPGEMIDESGRNSDPTKVVEGENVRRAPLTASLLSQIKDVRRIIQNDGSIINEP